MSSILGAILPGYNLICGKDDDEVKSYKMKDGSTVYFKNGVQCDKAGNPLSAKNSVKKAEDEEEKRRLKAKAKALVEAQKNDQTQRANTIAAGVAAKEEARSKGGVEVSDPAKV